jgi:hypothetical protein
MSSRVKQPRMVPLETPDNTSSDSSDSEGEEGKEIQVAKGEQSFILPNFWPFSLKNALNTS